MFHLEYSILYMSPVSSWISTAGPVQLGRITAGSGYVSFLVLSLSCHGGRVMVLCFEGYRFSSLSLPGCLVIRIEHHAFVMSEFA